MKREFYYPSGDKVTQIHAVEWKPDGEIKAVLQICHGMAEYIDRYDEFARYMSGKGYYVVGHDHLGHGESVQSKNDYGFFAEGSGNQYVIGDIHQLHKMTRKKVPDVPYFMLGHSMGSFLMRQYIQLNGQSLSGVILMGAGYQPASLLCAGKVLCRIMAAGKGWHYKSKLIHNMAFGSFNKKYKPARTEVDWVTSDKEMLDAYVKDPLCGFMFTVNAYYHMFTGMQEIIKKKNLKQIPPALPILLVSGQDDPVGGCGKKVERVYREFREYGIQDVRKKLYPGDRHEILNETDRDQVYEDISDWLEEIRKKSN